MLNDNLNTYSIADSIRQVRYYFDQVDGAVPIGDTNHRYVPTKVPAMPTNTIDNGYITFNISPPGENMIDLYNTFISGYVDGECIITTETEPADEKVPKYDGEVYKERAVETAPTGSNVTAIKAIDTKYAGGKSCAHLPAIWLGYIDSFYAVESYQLIANGKSVYTQDNAREEGYITSTASTTEAIKKVDVFSKARHKDVFNRCDTVRSGQIIEFNKPISGATTLKFHIPIKIDLRRFLILNNIRFLPAFAGNLQLKVKFSIAGMVWTPLSYQDILPLPNMQANVTSYIPITNHFTPIYEGIKVIDTVTWNADKSTISFGTKFIKFAKKNANFFEMITYCNSFSLDPNIYSDLVTRYSAKTLNFPIKRIDCITMDGSMAKGEGTPCTFTAAFTPLYVNTIYTLFKKTPNYNTTYENPLFEQIQLNCGAYGNIPAEAQASNDPIFYEMQANATNNNNDTVGFNYDVMRSITTTSVPQFGIESNDLGHYLCGFPCETDYTFQQGQLSNSPITYKLTVKPTAESIKYTEKPVLCFLRHVCLSIQIKQVGPPIVLLDDYDLSAPASE